ncbi:MAG: ABC transporter ATP-binding protein [Vicinamibacterales bacterium]
MDPIIALNQITKVFTTDDVETHALSDITLSIYRGEYVSISGPSGCGKSTLLSVLGLLDAPTRGTYLLNGREVASLPQGERARIRNREIGFIFQSFNLIGDLTVFENVELPLTYRGMTSTERRQRTHDALERVGMAHRAKHLPSQLSGGQQQRVAVARAVAGEPLMLLADEPTGNLDSRSGEAVMELLTELHKMGFDDLHGHSRPSVCETRRASRAPVRRSARRRAVDRAGSRRRLRRRHSLSPVLDRTRQ